MIKHNPNKEPKFQNTEMFLGNGRSTKAPLAILNKGCVLRIGIDIKKIIVVGL